jgi:HSP20 family protein
MVENENLNLKTSKKVNEELENEEISMYESDEEKEDIKSDKLSEISFNDIINTLKDKQEEFGQILSEYTVFSKRTLVDVIETDDSIIIKADLPRLKNQDIEIAISEDSVDIYAELEEENISETISYIQRERSYGTIKRSIKLPSKVKIKDAAGTFKDSVLTIKLPKLEKKILKLKIE